MQCDKRKGQNFFHQPMPNCYYGNMANNNITHLCEEKTLRFELERHTVSNVVNELLQPGNSGSSTCCCCGLISRDIYYAKYYAGRGNNKNAQYIPLLIPALHVISLTSVFFLFFSFIDFSQVRRRKISLKKIKQSVFMYKKQLTKLRLSFSYCLSKKY